MIREQIQDYRPKFSSDLFPYLNMPKILPHEQNLKGLLVEAYVSHWLTKVEGFNHFYTPKNLEKVNGYEFIKDERGLGISIHDKGRAYCELDNIVNLNGNTYGVEVKSNKLNGVESKIKMLVNVTREITQNSNANFLLFFPQASKSKLNDALRIEAINNDVTCINSGYKKEELDSLVIEYDIWHSELTNNN